MDNPVAKSMYQDARGIIRDIVVGDGWSVTYISFKKGAIRGGHYHKNTTQTDFIISGKLSVNGKELKKDDVISFPPGEPHTYEALEDSEMMSVCSGIRIGEDYAKDTFKIECK